MKKVRLPSLKPQRTSAGKSITQLAQAANVSDGLIVQLEALHPHIDGMTAGTCDEHVAQRIADALGVSLATLGIVRL